MAYVTTSSYDDRDVPAVSAAELANALALWIDRQHGGPRLAASDGETTLMPVEEAILGMYEAPAQGLAVLRRLNGLVDVLSSRRFRGASVRERTAIVSVAASIRLNARWGISPVRIAWALAPVAAGAVSDAA